MSASLKDYRSLSDLIVYLRRLHAPEALAMSVLIVLVLTLRLVLAQTNLREVVATSTHLRIEDHFTSQGSALQVGLMGPKVRSPKFKLDSLLDRAQAALWVIDLLATACTAPVVRSAVSPLKLTLPIHPTHV